MIPDFGEQSFISAVQRRAARVAVGASTARGQRAPGLIEKAREFLAVLPLEPFGSGESALFRSSLDEATKKLSGAFPVRGRSWGLARKLLNIFLRDALYTAYLRNHFHLDRSEAFYELPLDSITARCLRQEIPNGGLPRWKGVKHLTVDVSALYQDAASRAAVSYRVARVHLDAYWWAGDRRKN